ncbi:MAG: putative toxin-antitoxin system toxin component, PIN family [Burkholderiales bacterium]|nr:putative toxin-antitoxin system toxin component, PIN family [Burkholderiales bacterium]PZN06175.1 MAG: putative toxin-antitoxin system toxin component, PIN family [Pseudomonadota bacterium]
MRIVLDTNVVVSLLVFRDPRYARLATAWFGDRVCVVSDAAVCEELVRVLAYPALAGRCDPAAVWQIYRSRVSMIEPREAPPLPQCRDADDQKFLVLAAAAPADVLVTGDKALLRLRRRRLPFAIEPPDIFIRRLADETPDDRAQ